MSEREKASGSQASSEARDAEAPSGGDSRRQMALQRRSVQRKAARSDGGDKAAAATEAVRDKGSGSALPAAAAQHFGSKYGTDLSDVRVHTDEKSAQAAESANAEAFTYGKDVFFGANRFQPNDPHGQFVLGHELAHVAQQGAQPATVRHKKKDGEGAGDPEERAADDAAHDALETGEVGDEQEVEASNAADTALAGGRAALKSAPGRIRFFAQGDGSKNRGGHSYMTEKALGGMGLDSAPPTDQKGNPEGPAETRVARMGNWERDLSQVLTPATAGMVDEVKPLLNIIAIKDFGRGINLESFGTYDPVEHIDNPTDLRGSDVLSQGAMISSDTQSQDPKAIAAQSNNPDNGPSISGKHAPGTMGGTAGNADQAYADLDPRYQQAGGHQQRGGIMNPNDAAAYQVDESGIPKYIYASKKWCTETLRTSARLGRQKKVDGDEHLHGPRLFASGVHTLQDYFAHSNFMEIATNLLIRDGGLKIADDSPVGPDGEQHTVDAGEVAPGRVLNTQAHANDEHGNPMAGNLAIGDPSQGGQGQDGDREVLTTGSFNLTDTVDSLLEEIGDHWKLIDPFQKKEDKPSELTLSCLDYMEMDKDNPTDFSGLGNSIADKVKHVTGGITALADGGAGLVEGASHLAGGAVEGAGHLAGGAMHGLGKGAEFLAEHSGGGAISHFFGGAAKGLEHGSQSVSGAAEHAGQALRGDGDQEGEAIKKAAEQLGGIEGEFRGRQHTARELYQWTYAHGPLDVLQEVLRKIPKLGPPAADKVHGLQQEMHTLINGALATAWNQILDAGVSKLNKVIGAVREKTNIQQKKTPAGGGPLHGAKQAIANKFGNVSDLYDQSTGMPKENDETGTLNGIAPGSYTPPSHTEVAKDHGEIENDGAKTITKGQEGPKEEQGNWLSPIAQTLASFATEQVGVPVSECWDVVDGGGTIGPEDPRLAKVDEAVDRFFQHPADCDFWKGPLRAAIGSKDLGPSLLQHLQSAQASAPETPSHVPEIPKDHPANKPETAPTGPTHAAAAGQ